MKNKAKKITIKEYVKRVQDSQYIPNNLIYNESSQRLLESTRNIFKEEEKGNLRLFANNVTKFWVYPPNGLDLLKYVDERYFNRVILYFLFTNVVESLITSRRRKTVDLHLRSFLTEILDNYFSTKKIKRKIYENLTEIEKISIFDQFLSNFWSNLIELDLIDRTSKGVISLKKETSYMLFDKLITVKFRHYPCVYLPKPWDSSGINGGYYTTNTQLITKKPTFMGNVEVSDKLIAIINELQNNAWSIDFPLEYIKTDFAFSDNKVLFDQKKQSQNNTGDNDDIVQHLHTRFFLENFASKINQFYYPYTLDFRGRIYPMCSWGYSVTSSKKIRHCIRTTQKYKLTERGKYWLKVYLAHVLNLEQITYNQTVENIDTKKAELLNLIENLPYNYTKYLAQQIYNDINSGYSSLLIQLDATSSVYQIIGVIINDEKLMQNTNLLDENCIENKPNLNFAYFDIYTYIENICRKNLPHKVYEIFLDRAILKDLLMPLIYGKTMNTSVKDLSKYLKNIGDIYTTGKLMENEKLYKQYKTLQAYPIKDVLNALPLELKENFQELIDANPSDLDLFFWKKWYMCNIFYKVVYNSLYKEFPKLEQFSLLFKGKTPELKHAEYETPYFTFQNKHRKKKTHSVQVTIKKKKRYFHFQQISNEIEKKTAGEAANCVHSLDAYIMHYILENRKKIPVIPIHDCVMMHPNDADFILGLITEAYKSLQGLVSQHPVFSVFHKNGSIPITSCNIFKYEYKDVTAVEDASIKNDLLEEDESLDDEI